MNKTKQTLFAFFCLTLILAGCNGKGSADTTTTPKVVSIAGKWNLIQRHTLIGDSVKVSSDTTVDYPEGRLFMYVTKDGNYSNYTKDQMIDTGTYDLENNILVFNDIKYPDIQIEAEITTLTEHKMVTVIDKQIVNMRVQLTQTYTR